MRFHGKIEIFRVELLIHQRLILIFPISNGHRCPSAIFTQVACGAFSRLAVVPPLDLQLISSGSG
jgi:hypothetical protein